jgi:hypothetical protein
MKSRKPMTTARRVMPRPALMPGSRIRQSSDNQKLRPI